MKLFLALFLFVGTLDCVLGTQCFSQFQKYQKCLNRYVNRKVDKAVNRINALNNRVNTLQSSIKNSGGSCQSGTTGTVVPWYKKKANMGEVMTVKFPRRFKKTPQLVVALTGTDTYKGQNQRQQSKVIHKDAAGFTIQLKTWAGSIVYGAWYSWMACP